MYAVPQSVIWYRDSVPAVPAWPSLIGAQRAEVCVIGGGFTGLSAALELAAAGCSVRLLEAAELGWGCSGRNGGQINPGFACDHAVLQRQMGARDALAAWQLGLEGVALLRERVATHRIDCDLQSGILQVANKQRHLAQLRDWQAGLETLGYDQLSWHEGDDLQALLRAGYPAGVLDAGGGSLDPFRYLLGLARAADEAGAILHEHSRVLSWQSDVLGVTVRTAAGELRCDQLILAGNAYVGRLLPWHLRRFLPIGSFIGATRPLGALAERMIPSRLAACDMNHLIDYFRITACNRLLFGGRASARAIDPEAIRQTLRQRMAAVFPELGGEDFEYLWGGQVAMTFAKFPQFGRLGNRALFAQGYSGQGVALAGLAGQLMAEAVLGRSAGFDLLAKFKHRPVPPGEVLHSAIRGLALLWYGLRDLR